MKTNLFTIVSFFSTTFKHHQLVKKYVFVNQSVANYSHLDHHFVITKNLDKKIAKKLKARFNLCLILTGLS